MRNSQKNAYLPFFSNPTNRASPSNPRRQTTPEREIPDEPANADPPDGFSCGVDRKRLDLKEMRKEAKRLKLKDAGEVRAEGCARRNGCIRFLTSGPPLEISDINCKELPAGRPDELRAEKLPESWQTRELPAGRPAKRPPRPNCENLRTCPSGSGLSSLYSRFVAPPDTRPASFGRDWLSALPCCCPASGQQHLGPWSGQPSGPQLVRRPAPPG